MSLLNIVQRIFGQRQKPDDITSEEIQLWGKAVDDENLVHKDQDVALAMGFKGTPAQGTLISGRAERYWALNSGDFSVDEQPLHPVHVHVDYRKPLFPGETVRWELSDIVEGPLDTYELGRSCFVLTGKKLPTCDDAINVRVTVGTYSLPAPPSKKDKIRLYTDKKDITPEKVAMCNAALRRTNNDIPFSLPAAFPLSSLLVISGHEGLVSKIAIYPLRQPQLGPVDIALAIPPPKVLSPRLASVLGKNFSYNIRATVTQNDLPISGLDINCYSNTDFYDPKHRD